MLTARRALDKDWKRRSALTIEEFLAEASNQKSHEINFLGLGNQPPLAPPGDGTVSRVERVRAIADILSQMIRERLRRQGATAKHSIKFGLTDLSKILSFQWTPSGTDAETSVAPIELTIKLSLLNKVGRLWFGSSVEIQAIVGKERRTSSMEFPDVEDEPGTELVLANQVEAAIPELALKLGRAQARS